MLLECRCCVELIMGLSSGVQSEGRAAPHSSMLRAPLPHAETQKDACGSILLARHTDVITDSISTAGDGPYSRVKQSGEICYASVEGMQSVGGSDVE
jgi:hypothetical protein